MAYYSSKENQKFVLNTTQINGIQSLNLRYPTEVQSSLTINNPNLNFINSKFIEADLEIEYIPEANDIILNFTGNLSFSGKFNYNDKYFVFNTGLLNGYSLNYQLDSLINAKANIKVFAEVFSQTGLEVLTPTNLTIDPYDYSYIDIYFDKQVIDKSFINNFNLNIDCAKNPNYTIGKYIPDNFMPNLPLKIDFNINASFNEYNFSGISNIYNTPKLDNLTLKFIKNSNSTSALQLSFLNLTKKEESASFSSTNDGQVTLNYYTLY
jgi:hypothetical protein